MPSYYLRQTFPELRWQVVSISEDQARAMLERGERLYRTAAQAHAVARAMNKEQEDRIRAATLESRLSWWKVGSA